MGISRDQALACLHSDDLIGIGMEAAAVRRALQPENVVSYVVEQTLSCPISPDALEPALRIADRNGVTALSLTALPGVSLEQLESCLGGLRLRQPELVCQGLSATLIARLAAESGASVADVLERLMQAGFAALSGDDAYLLEDSLRQKGEDALCDRATWLAVHRQAHRLGLPTTASLTFGVGETTEARVDHLVSLYDLQCETGGFVSVTPVAFTPRGPSPTHRSLDEATATEYLTTLAVARMFLDTIPHVQASGAQGLKVLQMALRFGADDAGAVLLEGATGVSAVSDSSASEQEMRRLIRDAGFTPVERDSLFRKLYLI